jgi:hypothetical protein
LNALVFFSPILFFHFLFHLSNLYLQESFQGHKMVNSMKMVEIHPFQCSQFFDLALLHLELSMTLCKQFPCCENCSIIYTQCGKKNTIVLILPTLKNWCAWTKNDGQHFWLPTSLHL